MKHLLYATTNPGKIDEVKKYLRDFGLLVETASDLGLPELDVAETADTLGGNALLKVRAYLDEVLRQWKFRGKKFVIVADDTGMEIDGLRGEPGIHVRRWKDRETRMEDEEIVLYCIERMHGLHGKARDSQFRTVLAVGVVEAGGEVSEVKTFEGILRGSIYEKPTAQRIKGFPMESLFHVDEWGIGLGRAHLLTGEQKKKFLSHRELAFKNALSFLQGELL